MFKFIYNSITTSFVVLLVSLFSLNNLPDHYFTDFPLESVSRQPNNYDSVIPTWNTKLSDEAEYIQLNNILGPESVAISKGGLLYSGLADGRLIELDQKNKYKLRQVLRFKRSPKCADNVALQDVDCGRFLQLRFVNDTLYALESGEGLYKIDIKTGTKTFIGPKLASKVHLYNSFVFDQREPNLVYLTLTSTKWNLQKIVWLFFDLEPTGQLVALDINTGKTVIVLDKQLSINGIDLDANRDRLIFTDSMASQINTISLKNLRDSFKLANDGETLSNIQVGSLIPLVPGNPDNIVIENDIAYIALPFVKLNGKELVDHLGSMPGVRRAYARFVYAFGKLFEYIHENFYRHPLLEFAYKEFQSGHINYRILQSDKSAVIEYNLATGSSRLLGSDRFGFISEAVPDGQGNLLLCSFRSAFIAKVKV